MHLLALSGSLRAGSRNTSVLRAAALLAPPGVAVTVFHELDALPHFNPDLEVAAPPPAVLALRTRLAGADALLVCSPEYAHGVPGSFKNALDWLVGVGLERRPVGMVNAAPRSHHAHDSLAEILATMDGALLREAVIDLPLPGGQVDHQAIAATPALADPLRACVAALTAAGRAWRARAAA